MTDPLAEIREAWNTQPRADESNEDWDAKSVKEYWPISASFVGRPSEARRDTMVDQLLAAAPVASEADEDAWSAGYDEGFAASKRLCEALERADTRGSAGLDVERLRGMTDFWPNDADHRWCDEDSGGGHRFDSAAWAQDFAVEYARLARTTEEPT